MFNFERTIRFQDTDAAGVVYFAQVLSICHEGYEASLQATGVDLKVFFRGSTVAVPITHTTADLHRPLRCGDVIRVELQPMQISPDSFEIKYQLRAANGKIAAFATTRHVCIDTTTRQRQALSLELVQWLQTWGKSERSPIAAEQVD
ncbi:MAG: acyl-CoA thioesterase [Leptolyngbyaceae cyanobacterium]